MLYQVYETQRTLMEPFADFAQAAAKLYGNPLSPLGQNPFAQRVAAGYSLIYRLGKIMKNRPSTSGPSTSTAPRSASTNAWKSTNPFANCAASSVLPTIPQP